MTKQHTLSISLFLTLAGCFDSDEPPCEDTAQITRSRQIQTTQGTVGYAGSRWEPCRSPDIDAWGCNGFLGTELACLRPLADVELSICVPQTWGSSITSDCANIPIPTWAALGVGVHGSAYCVVECFEEVDCANGMRCSAHGICAWPE